MSEEQQHNERSLFGKLAETLCGLDQSITFLTRNLHLQFDWLKAHQNCATKEDLKAELKHATDKIIAAIRASNPAQDAAIVKATEDLKATNDRVESALDQAPKPAP